MKDSPCTERSRVSNTGVVFSDSYRGNKKTKRHERIPNLILNISHNLILYKLILFNTGTYKTIHFINVVSSTIL